MTAAQATLAFGTFIGGFVLPELIRILSPQRVTIPLGLNLACAGSLTLIVLAVSYGAFA
jgi:hypothetical protein